jgi:hypothetical protein
MNHGTDRRVVVDGGEGKYQEVFSSPGYDAFPCWVRSEKH